MAVSVQLYYKYARDELVVC